MKKALKFGCVTGALTMAAAGALADDDHAGGFPTATPIKHLVVIFQENVSFDHYFGTYPHAQNSDGTPFHPSEDTPKSINTLLTPLDVNHGFAPLGGGIDLINNNPNGPSGSGAATNGANAANPFRLSPAQALTADQGHGYTPEQKASDNGKMDLFPANTGSAGPPPFPPPTPVTNKGLVMGYFDGNTVTALWNYAQHFSLNDNSYTTVYGPSTPGALNLIAGQTAGIDMPPSTNVPVSGHEVDDGNGSFSVIGDPDPVGDVCSGTKDQVRMHGKNIGDLLNAKGITWGWFEGGFDLPNGPTDCNRKTDPTVPGGTGKGATDYIPHHQPFQYFASTENPTHARPKSVASIGHTLIPGTATPDPANHQYDIADFFDVLVARNVPAVSFLKARAFEDGHAGYSDPLDEQHFIVRVINALQETPDWRDTAVIIAYDDSDGWYDHQMAPVVNPSISTADALNGVDPVTKVGRCVDSNGFQQGKSVPKVPLNGAFGKPSQGRCGYGTRVPLLVISPFAKLNHVDHTLTDQTSILRFIEDNWLSGARIQLGGSFDTIAGTIANMFNFEDEQDDEDALARRLILDEKTGAVVIPPSLDGNDDNQGGE
jgi:phospholipase C